MWPGANGFAAIVQKKREIENQRVLEFLKNFAISNQFGIIRVRQRIEFVDTY